MLSFKAQFTCPLTSITPPQPLRDAGMQRAEAASSKDLTSDCHLEMNPAPSSQERRMIGRAPSGSSLFFPHAGYVFCRNGAAYSIHIVFVTRSADFKLIYFCDELLLCIFSSTLHTGRLLSLSQLSCSQNNLTMTIPLKLIFWEGMKNWHCLKWPIYYFIFSLFIWQVLKKRSQFPAFGARLIHPLLIGASETPKLCRILSQQTDRLICVCVCVCLSDSM